MSLPPESREEAIARLTRSASDLEARTTSEAQSDAAGRAVAGQAYKVVAQLLGGVFLGIAVGFGIDHYAGTAPWGVIGGVLVGFAVSLWMAWQTAQRLMAQAAASGVEPRSIPFDDVDDEER
ncbi:AtpZ/AtpI family protein [Brevundimonas aurifodinae]|uniref:ATP synthase protein I n=2 Tax=Brevundimonas TaxID=41275 RepID=A0ABV1NLG6_9CAUL|nr:MAG: F0F1 ATP synthase assembly protein I [Brevundimonas sp. 12-68-7]OYX33616.1 MAG: F0F1 ATP synthase assembly protein I [Brevundimonas subvibrioides]